MRAHQAVNLAIHLALTGDCSELIQDSRHQVYTIIAYVVYAIRCVRELVLDSL